MKVQSIISNTISEEILQTGHLSIRFMTDGFSLLLEDSNYRPILLNRFTEEGHGTISSLVSTCSEWLERHTLIENFMGEVTIIPETSSTVLVPKDLFSSENISVYFESSAQISRASSLEFKEVKNRPFVVVFPLPDVILKLKNRFKGRTRIIPAPAIMISMADQVNASDHQRGFALIEIQKKSLNILIIKNDQVSFLNQIGINKEEDLIYHTLNTLQQLDFNLATSPLFHAGSMGTNELQLLKKYIRIIKPLSYHLLDIDKESIPEHIVLAEATRCE